MKQKLTARDGSRFHGLLDTKVILALFKWREKPIHAHHNRHE